MDFKIIPFPHDETVRHQLDGIRRQLKIIRARPRWYQDAEQRDMVAELEFYEKQLVAHMVRLAVPPPPWCRPAG